VNGTLLFSGAAVVLLVLRWLASRLLPASLVGPGGFLIDTTRSRLGILQMRPRRHPWPSGPEGGNGGDGDC
jgi:hypothetical protein